MNTPQSYRQDSATPIEPLLASSLLTSEDIDSLLSRKITHSTTHPPPATVLAMPFRSPGITALSSETRSARTALATSLLVDHLLESEDSSVAVVDATGDFDVVGLYAGILKRVDGWAGCVQLGKGEEKERKATAVLDRVKILRVFDFEGVSEAVGELREDLEKENDEAQREDEEVVGRAEVVLGESHAPPKRTEVADSEDEDDDVEAEDEEMLFDVQGLTNHTSTSAPLRSGSTLQQSTAGKQPSTKLKMILIDNLAHVLTPLLKKDSVQANTLATTFLTTLADLTRTYGLHTLLLNPCTTPRAPSPTRPNPNTTTTATAATAAPSAPLAPQQHQSYVPTPPPPPSIFSSQQSVPALLGLLSRYADAHVLVSVLPRGKMDARVYYAETGGKEREKRRGVEMESVLEVIAERWGGSVGAWGTLAEGMESL